MKGLKNLPILASEKGKDLPDFEIGRHHCENPSRSEKTHAIAVGRPLLKVSLESEPLPINDLSVTAAQELKRFKFDRI